MKKRWKQISVLICCIFFCLCQFSFVKADMIDDVVIDFGKESEEPETEDVKDNESFIAKHQAEFHSYGDEFRSETQVKDIILWEYPFSSQQNGTIKECYGNLDFIYLYMDDDLKTYEWGYVEYKDGKKGWLCLNEPDNPYMPMLKADTDSKEEAAKEQKKTMLLAGGLVLGVVAITGVMIGVFYKKDKKKADK